MKPVLRELAQAEPDIPKLREDFLLALEKRDSTVFRRQRLNYEARYCVWGNQSRDGRKWSAPKGKKPFPWEGASDARVALVDKYINEDIAFLMVVHDRMRVQVAGTETNDDAFGHRVTNLLRWMKKTQMPEEDREMRLAANYMLERGSAVVGVFWERQQQLGYEEIDLESLVAEAMKVQQAAQQGEQLTGEQQTLAIIPALILDPSKEAQAIEVAAALYPDVARPKLKKVITDLRTTGHARLIRPYTVKNRPTVVALAPNEEVYLPPESTDLQTASGVYRRELLTESQLRERRWSHSWDRKWVDSVIATQRGKVSIDFEGNIFRGEQFVSARTNYDRLFEVIHAYRRLTDENGVPGIYYTCFHPNMTEGYAWDGLLDYAHGEYPFVMLERETRGRLVDESRGYGEIAFTWQNQIKTQWDSRMDRASIATLPPSYYPNGQAPDKWGPGVQIPTVRPTDYGFLEVPKYDMGSQEVEESVRRFSDEYFGRPVDEQNKVQADVMRQDMANRWMGYCVAIDTQMVKLMQQFLPDEIFFRVVGTSKSKPLHATRDEIQGSFDIQIHYNVGDLDAEVVQAKLSLIEKALMMDTTGRVDRNGALEIVFELIDPDIGERILRPAMDASQSEIDDEQNTFAKMFAGVDVDVKQTGQAYDLRLKVLQNILQGSPEAQTKLQSDQHFRQLVEKRFKQLQFQLQQRQNAIIGRLGA